MCFSLRGGNQSAFLQTIQTISPTQIYGYIYLQRIFVHNILLLNCEFINTLIRNILSF